MMNPDPPGLMNPATLAGLDTAPSMAVWDEFTPRVAYAVVGGQAAAHIRNRRRRLPPRAGVQRRLAFHVERFWIPVARWCLKGPVGLLPRPSGSSGRRRWLEVGLARAQAIGDVSRETPDLHEDGGRISLARPSHKAAARHRPGISPGRMAGFGAYARLACGQEPTHSGRGNATGKSS